MKIGHALENFLPHRDNPLESWELSLTDGEISQTRLFKRFWRIFWRSSENRLYLLLSFFSRVPFLSPSHIYYKIMSYRIDVQHQDIRQVNHNTSNKNIPHCIHFSSFEQIPDAVAEKRSIMFYVYTLHYLHDQWISYVKLLAYQIKYP
jgi:hypothetical protein